MTRILSPDEIENRLQEEQQRKGRVPRQSNTSESENNVQSMNVTQAVNRAGKVKIDYETMGRFSTPKTLWFEDYSTTHINDLSLCNESNILETLVDILNDIGEDEEGNKPIVEDMLMEEFLETMIAIKMTFDTPIHQHRWVCDCQNDAEREDMEIQTEEIDLRTINYITIEEADEKLKLYFKAIFDKMTSSQFTEFLHNKYKDDPSVDINKITKEEELDLIEIKEPIRQNINGVIHGFNFMRVRDLLEAKRIVEKEFSVKIKGINSKKYRKEMGSLLDFKAEKDKQIKDLEYEKAKQILLYSKALTLVEHDGQEIFDIKQKVEIYKKIKRGALLEFVSFISRLEFGISDEKELVCPSCGHMSKRSLRKEFTPLEFIPIQLNSDDELRSNPGGNIFM